MCTNNHRKHAHAHRGAPVLGLESSVSTSAFPAGTVFANSFCHGDFASALDLLVLDAIMRLFCSASPFLDAFNVSSRMPESRISSGVPGMVAAQRAKVVREGKRTQAPPQSSMQIKRQNRSKARLIRHEQKSRISSLACNRRTRRIWKNHLPGLGTFEHFQWLAFEMCSKAHF